MELKDNWKETGKGLGKAFAGLGKTLIKTAKVGVDKAEEWAENKDPSESEVPEVNVTNDGTWRETGKQLGDALTDLGRTLITTAKVGADKAEEWAEGENDPRP